MDKSIDIEKIKKFLANECSYVEAEEISAYLKAHVEELDRLDVFGEAGEQEITVLSSALKHRIYNKISPNTTRRSITWKKAFAAACIIAAMLGIFFTYNSNNKSTEKEEPAYAVLLKNIANKGTDTMHVLLPDGSRLILDPMAAITYQDDFASIRSLHLDSGNAYFIVARDSLHPFNVFANGIKTTALGTEFWVENNLSVSSIKVKLASGKVAVVSTDKKFTMDSVYLKPSQECWIDKRTGHVKVVEQKVKTAKTITINKEEKAEQPDNTVLWTNNNLQLSKAKLDNVLRKLENRYNVTIVVDQQVIDRATITGKILYSDSLDVIIKSICDINNLNYEKRNDTIFLTK